MGKRDSKSKKKGGGGGGGGVELINNAFNNPGEEALQRFYEIFNVNEVPLSNDINIKNFYFYTPEKLSQNKFIEQEYKTILSSKLYSVDKMAEKKNQADQRIDSAKTFLKNVENPKYINNNISLKDNISLEILKKAKKYNSINDIKEKKIIDLSRNIAALEKSTIIKPSHIAEAIQYFL